MNKITKEAIETGGGRRSISLMSVDLVQRRMEECMYTQYVS